MRANVSPRPADFLSVEAAATILGVSYGSILGAIRNGSLVAYRFGPRGGAYRIRKDDLADYTAACRTSTKKICAQPKPKKTASAFQKLDGQRLLDAWQDQGVLPEFPDEDSE